MMSFGIWQFRMEIYGKWFIVGSEYVYICMCNSLIDLCVCPTTETKVVGTKGFRREIWTKDIVTCVQVLGC